MEKLNQDLVKGLIGQYLEMRADWHTGDPDRLFVVTGQKSKAVILVKEIPNLPDGKFTTQHPMDKNESEARIRSWSWSWHSPDIEWSRYCHLNLIAAIDQNDKFLEKKRNENFECIARKQAEIDTRAKQESENSAKARELNEFINSDRIAPNLWLAKNVKFTCSVANILVTQNAEYLDKTYNYSLSVAQCRHGKNDEWDFLTTSVRATNPDQAVYQLVADHIRTW
jgi:hypothetical protein